MAMTLRLNEEQTARLRETAAREGVSMQDVAVRAIEAYTTSRMRRRDELIAAMLKDDAGVLKRLADS